MWYVSSAFKLEWDKEEIENTNSLNMKDIQTNKIVNHKEKGI